MQFAIDYNDDFSTKMFKCNKKINNILNILTNSNNEDWVFYDISVSYPATNFIIQVKNTKVSVACSIDTCGEIETILFKNNKPDDNTLEYHDNIEKLIDYLNSF